MMKGRRVQYIQVNIHIIQDHVPVYIMMKRRRYNYTQVNIHIIQDHVPVLGCVHYDVDEEV